MILAIDPGPEVCGFVVAEYGFAANIVICSGNVMLADLLRELRRRCFADCRYLAIEDIEPYGMMGGLRETCATKEAIGRLIEAWGDDARVRRITRKNVKRHLLGRVTGSDAEVRAELVHRLGDVGTKKAPGPLYGVKSHCWAALAVAVTCAETVAKTANVGEHQ